MDIRCQPVSIDETKWDGVIKPFIIVNGLRLYLQDGHITDNGIKVKVEFFYQSENEIAHICFEEAIGAIKNGRVGIGDVNKNNKIDKLISICEIVDGNKLPSPKSSAEPENGKPSTKLNKEVQRKILTYGKHIGIHSKRRPMPKSLKGLTVSPDVMKHIRIFSEKNTDFIKHNHRTNVADRYEEDDKYLTAFLYKLQPIVEIKPVDLIRLKQKYNSKNKNCKRSSPQTNHMNNKSQNKPKWKLKTTSKTKSYNTQKRNNIDSSDTDDSVPTNVSEEEMDEEIDTSKVRNSTLGGNADVSLGHSLYLESSEESSEESEKNMKFKSKNIRSKQAQSKKNDKRAYSFIEDRAIINYVLKSRHLSQVNGNVLWKELEKEYGQRVNKYRSWHSLRNRFLKSIRLNLRDFDLTMTEMIKLQMATFKGTSKKLTPAIVLPSVISAHTWRRQKNVTSKADKQTPDLLQKTDTDLNTIDTSTPLDKPSSNKFPTYTKIIKEFETQQRKDLDINGSAIEDSQAQEHLHISGFKSDNYLKKGSRKLFALRK